MFGFGKKEDNQQKDREEERRQEKRRREAEDLEEFLDMEEEEGFL